MFVDSAIITVKAGDGGAGHIAFRRQKYEAKGGPNGGDGGRGGDVVLITDPGLNTLLDFQGRPLWQATHGEPGGKKQQHGADGPHLFIRVPAGTLVFDHTTGELLADLGPAGSPTGQFVLVRGGYGGFGNEHYKSSTNQTPRYAHPGQKGEERLIRLELKLLADVGFVGLPNAGKSTLLAALTRATPKIGAYPFTTLTPQLGVAELDPARRLVLADIPGLIEGASEGKGLGHDFLKHIERTKVLVHLLDAQPIDGSTPAKNYRTIRAELRRYSPALARRREIIALNKMDLLLDDHARDAAVAALRKTLRLEPTVQVLPLSGATRQGTRPLLDVLWAAVQAARAEDDAAPTPVVTPKPARATKPAAKAKTTPASTPKAKAKAKAKPKPATKPKPKTKPKPLSKTKPKSKPKSKPKAKPAAKRTK
jgi:GTP-binding protein